MQTTDAAYTVDYIRREYPHVQPLFTQIEQAINDGLFASSNLQQNIDNAYNYDIINIDAHKRLSDYIDYCDQLIQTDLFDHTLQQHVDMR